MDRFELEEAMMAAWMTSDDLKLLYDNMGDLAEDELANWTLGLAKMHDKRMEKVFKIFEGVIQDTKIDEPKQFDIFDEPVFFDPLAKYWVTLYNGRTGYSDTMEQAYQLLTTMMNLGDKDEQGQQTATSQQKEV